MYMLKRENLVFGFHGLLVGPQVAGGHRIAIRGLGAVKCGRGQRGGVGEMRRRGSLRG